jgi:hypothetical protein
MSDPITQAPEVTTPEVIKPAKPIGFLSDPTGDHSSKRMESFLALVYGMLMPLLAGIFGWQIPVAELVGSFLIYSAAMQGVVYFSEKNMSSMK